MEERQYYVYILTNVANAVLYVGMTNDLERRMYEHRNKLVAGFTAKYGLDKLVYFEVFATVYDAITREKQLKGGSRAKKIALIEKENPTWRDLGDELA